MSQASERRNETRLNLQTTIFVEVCSGSIEDEEPANIAVGSSLDISTNGILVKISHAVPVGSILRLCADLTKTQKTLSLVGEVKWLCKEKQHFNIGFELYDAENTDILDWREMIINELTTH